MANVAVLPDLTSPEVEKDSTRTQSCGVLRVLWGGGDLVELGEGDGFGDLVPDGVGEGDGEVELVALSVGGEVLDGDFAPESEVLGVDDGLALSVWLGEVEALADADFEALGDADFEEVGEADLLLLAEPLGDADPLLRGSMIAADSTALFGGDEHVD